MIGQDKMVIQMSQEEKPELLAVIRLRGTVNVHYKIQETLEMLNIRRTNYMTLIPSTSTYLGMLKKARDFITWGEPNAEMIKKLESLGGKVGLHRPRGGFERKGIKIPFKVGGALGNRKEKINDLLMRMMP